MSGWNLQPGVTTADIDRAAGVGEHEDEHAHEPALSPADEVERLRTVLLRIKVHADDIDTADRMRDRICKDEILRLVDEGLGEDGEGW